MLQEVAEAHLVKVFAGMWCLFMRLRLGFLLNDVATNGVAIHVGRATMEDEDMVLVKKLLKGFGIMG